jgi:hypothetical protein
MGRGGYLVIWFGVPILSAVAALALFCSFRRRQSSRTPAVDAVLGGAGIFVCLALWGWGPLLLG